ncbi:MAG TPA: WD40 repeat domain-containing serine/threonine protein kinase, partial [Planctomycetota bacterium]|nr:WD40 repeat domain-containing serine/threonine protein kinase [Planctomycetota bacterium]
MAQPRDLVEDLVFECLEQLAHNGPAAVDDVLAAHEDSVRQQVRDTITMLQRVGLAGDAPPGEPAPDRFGPYRLLERVGSGAMGVVYRARRDDGEGPELALKLMQPGLLPGRGNRLRFQREIEALRSLAHPGICPILDDGEVDGVPFLVMPFVAGPSLRERFAARQGADAAARDVLLSALQQVAEALHHAHEHGLVHRDVKPANVVLAGGQAVLLDFGLARLDRGQHDSTLTATGGVVGTPAYMAPEQVAGRNDVDRRCDVYALGAMLYEGLTGRLPHEAPTRESLYRQILGGDIVPPSSRATGLRAGTDAVCMTALARDPQRRYQTARLFAEELGRLRAGASPLARLPGPLERTLRWVRRYPFASSLMALLSLAVLGIAAMALTMRAGARVDRARLQAVDAQRLVNHEPAQALAKALAAYDQSPVPEALVAIQAALAADQPAYTIPSFAQAITGIAFSADDRWLFAHDEGGAGRLFELTERDPVEQTLGEHAREVSCAAFEPRPSAAPLLVTGHRDGSVLASRLGEIGVAWRLAPSGDATAVHALSFSPDGSRLVCVAGGVARLVTAAGEVVAITTEGRVTLAAWVDEDRFVLAAAMAVGAGDQGRVSVWDARQAPPVELTAQSWRQPITAVHCNPHPERRGLLLVVPEAREASIWDLAKDRTELRPLQRGFARRIVAAGWSPDGSRAFLAAQGGRSEIFTSAGTHADGNDALDHIATGVAHPTQPMFALAGNFGSPMLISFYGQTLHTFGRRHVRDHPLVFSRDGHFVATTTWEHRIEVRRLFDPELPVFRGGGWLEAAQWTADGHVVQGHRFPRLSPTRKRGALRRWDPRSGAEIGSSHVYEGMPVIDLRWDRAREQALVVFDVAGRSQAQLLRHEDGRWRSIADAPEGALQGDCLSA